MRTFAVILAFLFISAWYMGVLPEPNCMASIISSGITIGGVLYEGIRELYFQKIPVKDIFGQK